MKKFTNSGQFKPVEVIIGATYHWWTVLSFYHKHPASGNYFYKCECACGKINDISGHRLLRGETKSCGCYRFRKGQNKKHGLKSHPLYSVWRGIKDRCLNEKSLHWPDYGGRGIYICDSWKDSVVNFYNDMHEGYEKGLHIGRIDNNGPYSKENCRWETPWQNSLNKRNSVYITHDGRTHTPAEWAKELFVKSNTICSRIRKGWTDYEALFGKVWKFDEPGA